MESVEKKPKDSTRPLKRGRVENVVIVEEDEPDHQAVLDAWKIILQGRMSGRNEM